MSDKDCNNCLNKSQKDDFNANKIIGTPTICMRCLKNGLGYMPIKNDTSDKEKDYLKEYSQPLFISLEEGCIKVDIQCLDNSFQAQKTAKGDIPC